MKKLSLRGKALLSVGFIIVVVLVTSTLVHIQAMKQDYLEAIEWRAQALAQTLIGIVQENYPYSVNAKSLLKSLSIECMQLYELNKAYNLTHIAVIDREGKLVAHSQKDVVSEPVESRTILDAITQPQIATILVEGTYHTLIPIVVEEESPDSAFIGTIDIGVPQETVDARIQDILYQSLLLLALYVVLAFLAVSLFMHLIITKPVRELVLLGQRLAEGNVVQTQLAVQRRDEIGQIATVFNQISTYLQSVAQVASRISTGGLSDEVRIRSKEDMLGTAMRDMLTYLHSIAALMEKIARGNLTEHVSLRSSEDAFGQAIRSMAEGLRALIVRIRDSAEEIAATGSNISSLATHDIEIVQNVTTSVEQMVGTMTEMGASVEDVSHNMDVLTASVEETSASVVQMTSSIANIASNTEALTEQSHQTIQSLDETVKELGEVVEGIDASKQLSQDTTRDALEGQQAVEQVKTSMETIHQTVMTAVDAINRFSERSQEIDTILDVIRNITEQTSLLALNASIIAAQAGNHGRGFAVVADEIRNLSNGVEASTKDIAAIVHSLKEDTSNVVQTIHQGAENVRQGMEQTQQAQATLQKILQSAERSSAVVRDIAATLHELKTTSQQVVSAMGTVDEMTDDITTATIQQKTTTEQISSTIGHINNMATQIHEATNQQLQGVHHVLEVAADVTASIIENQQSSHHITHTSEELLAQARLLLEEVDRFKLRT